jgi:hypothetical protein
MRIQTTNRTYHVDAIELMDAWRRGNDAGEGYAVGGESQSPSQAADEEGIRESGDLDPTGNIVAVSGDRLIVICDANGPWAVDVTDAIDEIV